MFDPAVVSYETILTAFWEGHDPTQGMRQGNDVGTQYRSGVYTYSEEQRASAEASRDAYQERLTAAGHGEITTEIEPRRRVLLRRGLPPAVPREGAQRLLRPRRHRRELPDRTPGLAQGPCAAPPRRRVIPAAAHRRLRRNARASTISRTRPRTWPRRGRTSRMWRRTVAGDVAQDAKEVADAAKGEGSLTDKAKAAVRRREGSREARSRLTFLCRTPRRLTVRRGGLCLTWD